MKKIIITIALLTTWQAYCPRKQFNHQRVDVIVNGQTKKLKVHSPRTERRRKNTHIKRKTIKPHHLRRSDESRQEKLWKKEQRKKQSKRNLRQTF